MYVYEKSLFLKGFLYFRLVVLDFATVLLAVDMLLKIIGIIGKIAKSTVGLQILLIKIIEVRAAV